MRKDTFDITQFTLLKCLVRKEKLIWEAIRIKVSAWKHSITINVNVDEIYQIYKHHAGKYSWRSKLFDWLKTLLNLKHIELKSYLRYASEKNNVTIPKLFERKVYFANYISVQVHHGFRSENMNSPVSLDSSFFEIEYLLHPESHYLEFCIFN